jgi:N,N'-diacetyllegionaminate synthase
VSRWEGFQSFEIAGRRIGSGSAAMVVAEVAQAHDGSLGMAHAFIDAAASRGADAVKFQTHIATAESTFDEPFRVKFSRQDATRFDYWRRIEFTSEQWAELANHARERNILFLSSAFSTAAVELLKSIGMPAWKVGSGEFRSRDVLEAMAGTGAPILYSTGMATWAEITEAVGWFRERNVPHALLQCTSKYPTPLDEVGLNVLTRFVEEFGCPVGLSDHSGKIYPSLAALARGASMIEVHITFDRTMFGPDVPASITLDELGVLCSMRDAVATMDAHPVKKDEMAGTLQAMRSTFGKSLAPTRALRAGTRIEPGMLAPKKPGGGIPPEAAAELEGRRLIRDVTPERLLRWEDIVEDRE